jgi:hypothetical protein
MENLAFAPALSLASKIRHKEISARELLECYSRAHEVRGGTCYQLHA